MNSSNLKRLRKFSKLTQEEVAERLNVSRQSIVKWESGESLPDIDNCIALSKLYDVSLDELVTYIKEPDSKIKPKGKHIFGVAKINEKRQIVLPEKLCEVFDLKNNDKLLLLGDESQGIAMIKLDGFFQFTSEILKAIKETDPDKKESE